jgi:hypothetical protein
VAKCGAQLLAELHTTVWRCGAAQLVRAHVASSLLGTTEIDCHLLHSILATADAALLSELRGDPKTSEQAPGTAPGSTPGAKKGGLALDPHAAGLHGARNEGAADLSPYLDAAGLSRPREQVMVVAPPLHHLALLLAVFTSTQLAKMAWSEQLTALVDLKAKLNDDSIDGVPLVCGIAPPACRARTAARARTAPTTCVCKSDERCAGTGAPPTPNLPSALARPY